MKRIALFLSVVVLSLLTSHAQQVYQVSTYVRLQQGYYDGLVTLKSIADNGDLGLGTFHGLDGELVMLKGGIYQVKADGTVKRMDDLSMTSPFATVCKFEADQTFILEKGIDLHKKLDELLPDTNKMVAFKIPGTFSYIKTRSIARQKKPYPVFSVATRNQPIFEKSNVKGTIVGFRTPGFLECVINVKYHFHFLSDDLSIGGHLLECEVENAECQAQIINDFLLTLDKE